jgi:arylsulfatase
LSAHIDLFPTISELCDVELPKNKKIDGRSLIPLLEGKNTENRYLFLILDKKISGKIYKHVYPK